MARPTIETFVDFDNPTLKRELMSHVGRLAGLYEVALKPKRPTRSARVNSWYWAAIVQPFFEFLRDQEPTVTDKMQAHIELKKNVLGLKRVRAGKVWLEVVPTTHDMDNPTFCDYAERCRYWLREQVGIETLDPGEFGVRPERVNIETGEVLA